MGSRFECAVGAEQVVLLCEGVEQWKEVARKEVHERLFAASGSCKVVASLQNRAYQT
jgi:hypothetical protein